MKILLLPIYYIVIWNYYLIYATFIYVCCDSFRIYCRGAKYSFFLEILSVIWTKKNIGKISTHTPFPILIYRTWKIKSPQKNFNTITFFENQNLSKKIFFWLNETKKKTKRKN